MKKNFEIRFYWCGKYDTIIISAKSRAQAKYLFWLRVKGYRPFTFLDVLKIIKSVKEVKR